MKKIIPIILVLALVVASFSGCAAKENTSGKNTSGSSAVSDNEESDNDSQTTEVDFSQTQADIFTERDNEADYDESDAVLITLNGDSATASSDSVKISGSNVTITAEATYIVSGELADGMLIVDAPDSAKLQIVLNGVNITSKTSAALYIREADKVFVTIANNTENSLANGGSFTVIDDNNIDAALFSKQDLTLNGSGSLTVTSPAGHGIVCKDDLVITGGTYTVNSASHGLDANDSISIANANFDITAGKDAVHSENSDDSTKGFVYIESGSIKATAEGDGISASAYMQIADGTIDLLIGGGAENGTKESSDNYGGFMGGGSRGMRPDSAQNNTATTEESSTSMKGLKAANSLLISGGDFTINSADDSIHSDISVIINGGSFNIASGDDALHAEDTLTVTSGTINISECYEGLEALHIEVQGGDIKLKASDDGLNAAGGTDQSGTTGGRDGMFGGGMGGGMSSGSNGSIKISGGTLYIDSSGDGIDANGTLEILGGYTTVVGPTQGDTATLDYDKSATISGGTFIGTGAQGMAQSFSDSTQGVIALSVGNQSAGAEVIIKDSSGKTLIAYKPELSFAVVIFSSPEVKKGDTYTITVGSQTGEFEAN